MFVYSVSEQALWQLSHDIAVDHGIPDDPVRYLLRVTTFAGLARGADAAWLGTRAGRFPPLPVAFRLDRDGAESRASASLA